jgi:nicotinamidase-related amidase
MSKELPIPNHFKADKVEEVWAVDYYSRAKEAETWAKQHGLKSAATDKTRICNLLVDCQVTFCIPGYELYVGGRSGTGAVDDNVKYAEFIYRNLGIITENHPTMDTHMAMQIFHPIFWVNDKGEHPEPMTVISYEAVHTAQWQVNPAIAKNVANGNYAWLQRYVLHYVKSLADGGKYPLIIWPYHAMLGSSGHALVPAIEEALFFHTCARGSQTGFEIKGGNPLTENYSVLRPEVLDGPDLSGKGLMPIAQRNTSFIEALLSFDAVIIGGQAKSHCVAWTIDNLVTVQVVK